MKNKTFKKSISLIMTVLMIMSCWVWVAPMEAEALATVDTYRKADKYGTPYWDGSDVYYSKWNSGGSYTTVKWPKHIYMDVSETLQSAGYYYTVDWSYGSGTNYRIINNGFIFGGWGLEDTSGWPSNYYTMTNMFNNYDLDGSLSNGGFQQTSNSTDGDLFVGVSGLNWSGAKSVIFRSRASTNSEKVFMLGTPKATGTGRYSTSGSKPSNFGGWQEWKKPNIFSGNSWVNASDTYTTSNDSSNWTTDCYEGTWKEVAFDITIYDKSELSSVVALAKDILTNKSADYSIASLNNLKTVLNNNEGTLTKREVKQGASDSTNPGEINGAKNNIQKAINALKPYITFDNLINFNYWDTSSASSATISNIGNGGFTLTSNSGAGEGTSTSPLFAVEEGKKYRIDADITGDGWDIYIFFYDENTVSGTGIGFVDNATRRVSSNGSAADINNPVFTAPSGAKRAVIRLDANGSNNAVTFKEIRVYEVGTVGDNVSYVDAKDFNYGDLLGNNLNVPTRTGYTFNRWYVDTVNANKKYDSDEEITDNNGNVIDSLKTFAITQRWILYSDWTEHKYNIIFDANGGSGSTASINNALYSADTKLTSNGFSKTGYAFNGWNTKADGSGTSYADGAIVSKLSATDGATVTLYAVWTINKYTVTFKKADGSTTSAEYNYGETVEKPANTTIAKDADGHTIYTWPTIGNATGDVTYEEIATRKAHEWTVTDETDADGWKVIQVPDCTYTGIKSRICSVCNYTETETLPKDTNGHNNTENFGQTDATCTTNGYTAGTYCHTCETWIEGHEVIPAQHTLTQVEKQDPTCTVPGWEAYEYCSKCGYTTKTEIPATKHKWGEVTYAWADDFSACTATRVCENDNTHKQIAEATVTSAVTVAPKCGVKGETTYTATFTENWADEQTETEEIAALEHIWSETYTSNGDGEDNTHYQTCTRENCGAKNTAVVHTWNDGVIDPDSTCITGGTKTFTCTAKDCGATYTVDIAAKGHKFGDTVTANAATCENDGNKAYKQCTVCSLYFAADAAENATDGKADTSSFVLGKLGHDYATTFTVDKKATCEEAGSKSKHCSRCTSITEVTEIPAREHSIVDAGAAKEATCTENGVMNQKCKNEATDEYEACSYTTTAEIPAKGHTFTDIAAKEATCLEAGNVAYKQCTVCNLYFAANADDYSNYGAAENGDFVIAKKEHSYTGDYKWNDSADPKTHSQMCVNGCNKYGNKTKCTFEGVVTAPTCYEQGYTTYTCTVCNNSYDDDYTTREHVYVYAAGNGTQHVITCEYENCNYEETENCSGGTAYCNAKAVCEKCETEYGEKAVNNHASTEIEVKNAKDATCSAEGYTGDKYYKCCDTLKEKGEAIVKLPHTSGAAVEENRTESTCTVAGSYDSVVYCSVCKAELTRDKVALELAAHTAGDVVIENEVAATCTADGSYDNVTYCTVCSVETSRETIVEPASGHTDGNVVVENEVAATCTVDGSYDNVTYCTVCNVETSRETIAVPASGHTEATKEENRIEPSCGANGSYDLVTYCSVCKKVIKTEEVTLDATGEHNYATEVEGTRVPATCTATGTVTMKCGCGATKAQTLAIDPDNHDWDATAYNFAESGKSCTATRVCKNDASHVETAEATITSTVKTPATCTVDGWTTYTATFAVDWAKEQTKDVQDIPAIKHDWNDVTYSWADDHSVCTATRVCKNDASHVETAKAEISSTVKTPATCTVDGWTTYTATFAVDWAKEQTKDVQDIPAIKHDWNDVTYSWADDHSVCTATRVCKNDASHVETAKAEISSTVKTPATCTVDGWTTYTATFAVDWAKEQTKDVQDIPAIKHDWNDVTYSWADDHSVCTATRVCKNDASHVETAKAEISSTVKTPATCTVDGWTTYTATFAVDWAKEQTKDVQDIPAIKHDWDATAYSFAEDGKSCTASRTCKRNEAHIETATAKITSEVTVKPTCTEKGTTTYTATFKVDWAEKQTNDVQDIEAIKHDWDKTKSEANLTRPVQNTDGTWTKGYYTYTCKNDASHTDKEFVDRASYNSYESAWNSLESLLNTDLTAEAKDAIQTVLYDNRIADNLIAAEQETVDTAEANLKATFEQYKGSLKTYTVTFKIDGSDDVVATVISGQAATAPTNVTKAYDDTYHYNFTGWNVDFSNVTSDLIVTAQFETIEHSYTHTKKDNAYHTAKCACGYSKDVEHTETSEVTTKATCEADGVRTYTCSVCDGTRAETISKRAHTYIDNGVVTPATCSATGVMNTICTNEETETHEACRDEATRIIEIDSDAHSWEKATYVWAEGYASCTATRECLYNAEHKQTANAKIDVTVNNSTCTVDGTRTYTATFEGVDWAETQVAIETISAKGHTAGAAATCTTAQICTVCKTELVAKLGHDEVAHEAKAPTCTEIGWDAYVTCLRCDYSTYVEKAALDHDYKSVVTAPTCEAKGYTTHTCSRCNNSYVDTYVDATDHSLGEYIIDKAATCTEAGSKHKECVNCDYKTEAEAIEKLEHSYTGEFVYSSETKTHAQECIYGCGTYSESTPCTFDGGVKFEPDCANEGYVLHTCTICNGNYKTDVVPSSGHKWGSWEHIEGTDTHKKVCAINSEHTEVVTCVTTNRYIAPTCTKEGLSEDICTECNYKYNSNKVSAYGHRYIKEDGKENAVVIAPGCTTQGSKYLICVLCDAKTEPVVYGTPKGHQLYIEKGYGPTCTENGYTDYEYCLREGCNYVKEPETIKATGHDDNGSGTCLNCDKPLYEGGSKACNCMCHSESFIIKFIYKIVLFFWKLFRIKADCACGGIHY